MRSRHLLLISGIPILVAGTWGLTQMARAQSNIVATVSYNASTHEISVSPDPIEVEPGTWTLVWEKDNPSANWEFDGLEFENPTPFSGKYVSPLYISVTDTNSQLNEPLSIKYAISVKDLGNSEVYKLDPLIENKPG